MAAPYRSGLWLMQAATSRPPLEPPCMVTSDGLVYCSWMRYSAAAWKSSNTFCLLSRRPALCHLSPYSLGEENYNTFYTTTTMMLCWSNGRKRECWAYGLGFNPRKKNQLRRLHSCPVHGNRLAPFSIALFLRKFYFTFRRNLCDHSSGYGGHFLGIIASYVPFHN